MYRKNIPLLKDGFHSFNGHFSEYMSNGNSIRDLSFDQLLVTNNHARDEYLLPGIYVRFLCPNSGSPGQVEVPETTSSFSQVVKALVKP